MPAASPQQTDGPHQLWLDVARPIQPRPRRTAREVGNMPQIHGPAPQSQFELRMAPAPAMAAPKIVAPVRAPAYVPAPPELAQRPSFAAWLVNQGKQPGSLGELARAVKLDRLFPKAGSADDVRARFSAAGADGDAFEALDDAEREFDRLG